MNYQEEITDSLDRVEAKSEEWVANFDEQFPGQPYGLNSLTDEEHAVWFESQVAKWPPEAFRTKDGQVVVGSPWVIQLPFTENGDEELRRYMKTRTGGN